MSTAPISTGVKVYIPDAAVGGPMPGYFMPVRDVDAAQAIVWVLRHRSAAGLSTTITALGASAADVDPAISAIEEGFDDLTVPPSGHALLFGIIADDDVDFDRAADMALSLQTELHAAGRLTIDQQGESE